MRYVYAFACKYCAGWKLIFCNGVFVRGQGRSWRAFSKTTRQTPREITVQRSENIQKIFKGSVALDQTQVTERSAHSYVLIRSCVIPSWPVKAISIAHG